MSFYYCKVPEKKKISKLYGFKKVEQKELDDITQRLTRPTCNNRFISEDLKRLHHYVHLQEMAKKNNLPPVCKKRPTSASALVRPKSQQRMSDKDFNRLLRRLRKPTISSRVSQANFDPKLLTPEKSYCDMSEKPRSSKEKTKSLESLCRPTTASSYKSFDKQKYAGDNYYNYDYEYVYTSSAPPDEIDSLVDRVNKTTISRGNGSLRCTRAIHRVESEVELRKTLALPLVSGLPKSRNVNEIVDRLYTPSRMIRSHTPAISIASTVY